jgi:hypothetical protein
MDPWNVIKMYVCIQWVPGGPFPGGKARPGRDADHSPPSSAKVKYE